MSVGGNADSDAHKDAEGTPINFLNVVEANSVSQNFNAEPVFFNEVISNFKVK
jgi:hypothetical protein